MVANGIIKSTIKIRSIERFKNLENVLPFAVTVVKSNAVINDQKKD